MSALEVVASLSLVIGAVASLAFLAFSIYAYRRRVGGRALLIAATIFVIYAGATGLAPDTSLATVLETFLLGSWFLLLIRALGYSLSSAFTVEMRWVSMIVGVSVAAFIASLLNGLFGDSLTSPDSLWATGPDLLLCLGALVIIEQLVRNTRADLKSRMRYLNIGLGALFSFHLLYNSVILISSDSAAVLASIKPAVAAIPVPFLVIATMRNPDSPLRLNLSREFIFGSGVLIVTGIALLSSALLAYLAGERGHDFSLAVLMACGILSISLVLVFAGSSRIQAWAQRLISRHLLADRYDFRMHWNRVTDQLAEADPDFSLEQQAIRALTSLFHSPGGALWLDSDGTYAQSACLHVDWISPLPADAVEALRSRTGRLDEVIDLQLEANQAFQSLAKEPALRFLMPLISFGNPLGVIGIAAPLAPLQLLAEDRELARLTARQISGVLALREADRSLAEASQFEAMHRLTTFLVHDLNTTSAQLSLILENADRHKSNPQFVDDMLDTVANAVDRLDRLLHEIRGKGSSSAHREVKLATILPELVTAFAHAEPVPILDHYNSNATIYVDAHRLIGALQHLLQNAVDACQENDRISISTQMTSDWLDIVIEDTGTGMDSEFVAHKLFAPFETTKGVSGMGVGAYQVRDFAREMGGDLLVASTSGMGSRFTLRLPLRGLAG